MPEYDEDVPSVNPNYYVQVRCPRCNGAWTVPNTMLGSFECTCGHNGDWHDVTPVDVPFAQPRAPRRRARGGQRAADADGPPRVRFHGGPWDRNIDFWPGGRDELEYRMVDRRGAYVIVDSPDGEWHAAWLSCGRPRYYSDWTPEMLEVRTLERDSSRERSRARASRLREERNARLFRQVEEARQRQREMMNAIDATYQGEQVVEVELGELPQNTPERPSERPSIIPPNDRYGYDEYVMTTDDLRAETPLESSSFSWSDPGDPDVYPGPEPDEEWDENDFQPRF